MNLDWVFFNERVAWRFERRVRVFLKAMWVVSLMIWTTSITKVNADLAFWRNPLDSVSFLHYFILSTSGDPSSSLFSENRVPQERNPKKHNTDQVNRTLGVVNG